MTSGHQARERRASQHWQPGTVRDATGGILALAQINGKNSGAVDR